MTDNPELALCAKATEIVGVSGDLIVKNGHLTELFFHVFNCAECVRPKIFGLMVLALAARGEKNINLGLEIGVGVGGELEKEKE